MAAKGYSEVSVDPVPQFELPPRNSYGQEYKPPTGNPYGDENKPVDDGELRLRRMLTRDMTLERRLQVLKLLSRITALVLSAIILGTLVYTLDIYLRTRNMPVPGLPTLHPWATPTKLWPTIMVISVSALSFFFSLSTLIAWACSRSNAADKIETYGGYVDYLGAAVLLIAWVVTTILYQLAKLGNNPTDLYGYSCSTKAAQIQAQFESIGSSEGNFGKLCTVQTYGQSIQITTDVGHAITVLMYSFAFYRWYHGRKMRKHPSYTIVSSSFYDDSAKEVQEGQRKRRYRYEKGDGFFYCFLALTICVVVGLVVGLYFHAKAGQ